MFEIKKKKKKLSSVHKNVLITFSITKYKKTCCAKYFEYSSKYPSEIIFINNEKN